MKKVISKDKTTIVYETTGNGVPLILVDGALCYPGFGANAPLVPLLEKHFTVVTYYRRGRGESGDTKPFTSEKEIEDIDAIIKDLGKDVYIFGISSGGALALEAANNLKSIKKLAIYEAPFIVDNSREPLSDEYVSQLKSELSKGNRGEAVKMFMKAVGVPSVFLFIMQLLPVWKKLKAVAHTLPNDFAFTIEYQKGKPLPAKQWSSVKVPTLVMNGGKSPDWMKHGMKSLSEILDAKYKTLDGQTHIVNAKVLAPVLEQFFRE